MTFNSILITGASRGIGAALAKTYAKQGVTLFLLGRDVQALAHVANQCQQQGAECHVKQVDVTDKQQTKSIILDCDAIKPLELVVANAGASSMLAPGWQAEPEADFERVINTNVLGVLNTINPVVELFIQRKRGQIALMSSIMSLRGFPHAPSYSAAKAFVKNYAESLRAWLSRYDVMVNEISPGYVKTEMSEKINVIKPMMVSADKAASIIVKGIEKNKARIVFPKTLHLLVRMTRLMLPSVFNYFAFKVEAKHY